MTIPRALFAPALPGQRHHRAAALLVAGLAAACLAGCANRLTRAPVEERSPVSRVTVAAASPALEPAVIPEARPATDPKAGFYVVKPGDTLIRIGLDNGQNWKDIVRWNNLTNPNLIEVGQVLRIVAPGTDPAAVTTRPVTTARVETKPLDTRPAAPGASVPLGTPAASQPSLASLPPVPALGPSAPPVPAAKEADDDVPWIWPVASAAQPYNEARDKGLVFRGKAGDPVLAAADGRVVYAGSGLRTYGNLVILKHNATYITAYAHNQKLLVKDDETVRRGQKIAEMGSTEADGVQLSFELRRGGKPIDPTRVLPAR